MYLNERGKYVQNIIYHYARREGEIMELEILTVIQNNGSTDRQTDMRAHEGNFTSNEYQPYLFST